MARTKNSSKCRMLSRWLTLGVMCGRFALSMTPVDLAGVFGTRNAVPNFRPNWNLPPSQPAPVVRHNPKTGERGLEMLRWGLIPHFERDPAHARMLNNARAVTVAKLPSFRGAFAAQFHPHVPNRVRIEPDVGPSTLQALSQSGRILDVGPSWTGGFLCAIERSPETAVLEAGCDPRVVKSDVFPACALAY